VCRSVHHGVFGVVVEHPSPNATVPGFRQRGRFRAVDHPMCRAQDLRRFQNHLDDVLVAVHLRARVRIPSEKEDVHDFSSHDIIHAEFFKKRFFGFSPQVLVAEILGGILFGLFSVSLIVSVAPFLVAVVEVRVHLPRRVVFELRVPIVAEVNRRTTVREHGLIFFVLARRRTNDVHDYRASNHGFLHGFYYCLKKRSTTSTRTSMRVDALTEYAIRWIATRTRQRDERKLNHAISKKSKTLRTTESPIVRFRLENELRDMRQELRRKQQQHHNNK
jgi:hypothetical protein